MAKAAKKCSKAQRPAAGSNDPLVQSAIKLIDQAASLLKDGVITSAGKTVKARHAVKVKASALVNQASAKLTDAIEQGATALRKGLKNL
jgi:gamma-glutamyl phosphate reductase